MTTTSKPTHAFSSPKSPKRLQDLAKNLKTAFGFALPSSDTFYERVSVIAFHWVNDDMGVETLESELLEVFRVTYNYDTETYVIPLDTSHVALNIDLNEWSLRHAGANSLRIYIYSGHAAPARSKWYIGSVP
jgi:hypothetical protein